MTKQLVKADVNNLAVMPDYIQTETGLGLSTRAEDNLVPFIKLLQKGSPEVNKNEDAYIEGAEAGAILLRNPDVVVSGDDGIIFQPCHHSVMWVEWHPDRGGFVASYDRENPPVDMVQAKEAKRRFYRRQRQRACRDGLLRGLHLPRWRTGNAMRNLAGVNRAQIPQGVYVAHEQEGDQERPIGQHVHQPVPAHHAIQHQRSRRLVHLESRRPCVGIRRSKCLLARSCTSNSPAVRSNSK